MSATSNNMTCKYLNRSIPVTEDKDEFIIKVRDEGVPYGLKVVIDKFNKIYGELLGSAYGRGNMNPFFAGPSTGPCYVVCAECEVQFSHKIITSLGANTILSAFRIEAVTQCPECGNDQIVIVSP